MELQFKKSGCQCLDAGVRESRNLEQTQEIKLPDSMPDIGRVLAAWGQCVMRSKEWNTDSIGLIGGMQIWVLYQPEDGSGPRCIDSWIPFQMRWELPEGTPEGKIRIGCMTRFVDARSVAPRKIIVRAGVSSMAEGWVEKEAPVYIPEKMPDGVELLRSIYPVRLPREVGEKAFVMDEDLALPPSAPIPEKILYYTVSPQCTDQKVVGNKVVFRGNGNLHVLFSSEDGQLYSWDFELPFSQFAELDGSYSTDAQADLMVCPNNVELELDDEGHFRLKCALVGQYLVDDLQMLEVVEDAYSTQRDLELHRETLELPVILESRKENLYGEQNVSGDANIAADVRMLTEYPRQRRMGDKVELEIPGSFQVLYYGADGSLQSSTGRWNGSLTLNADENCRIAAMPAPGVPRAVPGNGNIGVSNEIPLQLFTTTRQGIPVVTGLNVGEVKKPDSGRPSLILRRAGTDRLWDIAKKTGSTVEDICRANGLEAEPAPDRMLLIPVR